MHSSHLDSPGLFELASKLASSLEEDGVDDVAALREEWAQDTVHTYSFLLGLDENHCHGADLKIYVHLAALRTHLSVVAMHVVIVERSAVSAVSLRCMMCPRI